MEQPKFPICQSCGKTIETQTIREEGPTYCESCRPSQKHDKTVALETDPGDKVVDSGATQRIEEKTVSTGKTEGESRSGEKTQPTTMVTMSKSVSATKAIRDALNITPDVDLEHASKCYSSTRGKPSDAADAATITDLLSHADIESKYVFDKELGHGAMGAVLVMVDQDIRRKVAMKLMLRGTEASVGETKRFLEEAQVTGQLEHPNIVPIHDIGIDDEAKIYYTMKLVRGETLESIIAKIAEGDPTYREKYSLGNLLQIFLKISDGLGYAHSKGVLHRDLKPENIMVGNFGEVMVMDWGLAKVLGRDDLHTASASASPEASSPGMTVEGQVMGTPSYMSPEQARGKVSELDERSDVFSLGGILYKMLTYESPYKARTSQEALDKARNRKLVPPDVRAPRNHIPPELAAICMKAMAPEQEGRYGDAMSLKKDIQLYLDGRSVSAKKDSLWVAARKWVIRNKVASLGIAAAVICLVLGVTFTAVYEKKKKQDTIAMLLKDGAQAVAGGKFETAEELFFSVLGLDPQNAHARKSIAEVSGSALASKNKRLAVDKAAEARKLFSDGKFIQAYDAYVATLALDPHSSEAMEGIRNSALKAERQKAQEKIAPLLAETEQLAEQKKVLDKKIGVRSQEIAKLKSQIKGYEDFPAKKPLWDLEKTFQGEQIDRLQTEAKIISDYSTVLGYDGENTNARSALARIYYDKFSEAEAMQDEQSMVYYKELLLTFDDGTFRDLLNAPGTLTVTTVPKADSYFLYRFVEGPDRRMIPAPFSPSHVFSTASSPQENQTDGIDPQFKPAHSVFQPITKLLTSPSFSEQKDSKLLRLPKGSYLLIIRKQGYADTRLPVIIRRGEQTVFDNLQLMREGEIPKGFVYVPKGEFSMGGDPRATYAAAKTVRNVPGFLISQHEVTVGEYLEFINFLEERLPGSAEKYLPRRAATSGYYWKKSGDRYQSDFPPDWPVLGISWDDARAYCKWLTLQHKDKGWDFRLPEDWEWEKAARGADGRYFPWGNCFDFRFCSMVNTKAGKRDGPDKVEAVSLDESVFGVHDMGGNVSEWCATYFDEEQNMRVTRGGAWSFADENFARCASKTGHSPVDVADYRGFRIAASLK